MRGILAAAAAVVIVAAGCGSGAAPTSGCKLGSTEEMWVQAVYECPDGHSVYTFKSNGDRDAFRKVAEMMEGHTLKSGDRWLKMDY